MAISFESITYNNFYLLKQHLLKHNYRLSDYSMGSIYIWSEYYHSKYAIIDDFLVIQNLAGEENKVSFSMPIGEGCICKCLGSLISYAKENNITPYFNSIPPEALGDLKDCMGDLKVSEMETSFDYLYSLEDLSELVGKKYNGQRNHINKFNRLYPNYSFKIIDKNTDIEKLDQFLIKNYQLNPKDSDTYAYEEKTLRRIIRDFASTGLTGAYIEINGEIAAFTIGEVLKDILHVHIEKALREYEGVGTIINRDFTAYHKGLATFVNRQEDMGDPGLRRAKESYHPVELLIKYSIRPRSLGNIKTNCL